MRFDVQTVLVVVVVLHALGMLAAIHAMMYTRTPQGAAAWAVALVSLPYLTLVPYLFLGRNRFKGYVEAHRRNRAQWHAEQGQSSDRRAAGAERVDEGCARYAPLCALLGEPFRGGHRLQLLIDGTATFEAMLGAIAGAREYVLVQFFALRDDRTGNHLKQALIERARAGVRVRVLYDGIGSHDLPRHYVNALRKAGARIRAFTTRRWSNRLQVNFRNHRKIVVVDGQVGFVGGLNVGDLYTGAKPPLSPWRDTHLRVEGPVVTALQRSFAEGWHWATGENLAWHESPAHDGGVSCLPLICGPADRFETAALAFVTLIQAAQHRLWLTSPYFIPDGQLMAAFQMAVLRGVDVRILIPARADHRIVFEVSTMHAHQAEARGIRVFRYRDGFIHEKVMLVDDDTALIGSVNLDNRSMRLNFEAAVLTVDKAFAGQVQRMLEADFARSFEIRPEDYRRLPMWRRVFMHVMRLFDPIL